MWAATTSPKADSPHGSEMMLTEGALLLTLLGEMEELLKVFQRKGNCPRDLHQPSLNPIQEPSGSQSILASIIDKRDILTFD